MDGNTHSVASSALGNTAVTLGAVGLGLSLLNGNGLNGILGGGNCQDRYVTKDSMAMAIELAKKDAEIARLESEKSTDAKLVDVYNASTRQDRELRALITAAQREQSEVNAQQMAWNATAGVQMSTMANQIASQAATLASITTSVVPQSKVCDTGCCGCAG